LRRYARAEASSGKQRIPRRGSRLRRRLDRARALASSRGFFGKAAHPAPCRAARARVLAAGACCVAEATTREGHAREWELFGIARCGSAVRLWPPRATRSGLESQTRQLAAFRGG